LKGAGLGGALRGALIWDARALREVKTPSRQLACKQTEPKKMGRAQVVFKCVIDHNETAKDGPTCGRVKCKRLFECIPLEARNIMTATYKALHKSHDKKMVTSQIWVPMRA